jgi:iron(III) transport system substrate-binding protein
MSMRISRLFAAFAQQYARIALFREGVTTDGTDDTDNSHPARNPIPSVKSVKSVVKFLWLRLCCGVLGGVFLTACNRQPGVIVYTSQDEVYAEPILNDFEKQSGIQVKTVFDSEAVKTVGLVNRLLAEKSNPQCDVFWNNEEFRTRQLASKGVFRDTNAWTRLGYRTRRIVINTNFIQAAAAPRAWSDVTNKIWFHKVALAYPLFGTTSTHFQALRQLWGDAAWQSWCHALAANAPFVVDGNSVVVKQVARGEAWIGLADSDDIADAQQEGAPILALPVTPETLFLPNTVAVIKNCPHPEAAQKLYDFLRDKKTSQRLVDAHALEGATLEPAAGAAGLAVNWDQLLRDLEPATAELEKIFLR